MKSNMRKLDQTNIAWRSDLKVVKQEARPETVDQLQEMSGLNPRIDEAATRWKGAFKTIVKESLHLEKFLYEMMSGRESSSARKYQTAGA
jgi:hypothetical protein